MSVIQLQAVWKFKIEMCVVYATEYVYYFFALKNEKNFNYLLHANRTLRDYHTER